MDLNTLVTHYNFKIKEVSNQDYKKVKESSNTIMELNLKEFTKVEKEMEWGKLFIRTVLFKKDFGRTINKKSYCDFF